jgi:hypothetical protein
VQDAAGCNIVSIYYLYIIYSALFKTMHREYICREALNIICRILLIIVRVTVKFDETKYYPKKR